MQRLTPKTSNLKPNSGFTVLEIIIALVISSAIAALGLNVGIDVYRSGSLSSDRDTLVSALEKARNRSVTNLGESTHGVYLEENKYTIFRGPSYASRDTEYDNELVSPPTVKATGTIEYVFEQLSGDGLFPGTTTLIDDRGSSLVITVNEEGRIDW